LETSLILLKISDIGSSNLNIEFFSLIAFIIYDYFVIYFLPEAEKWVIY
jgi:hypothetical protein